MDPRAMLASLAGAAGAPPAGGMPSAPPNMAALGDVGMQGLSSLDRLANKDPNGRLALEQVKKALNLAQQLIGAALPHITQMNPQVAKDLHVIGRQVADARLNLDKEDELGMPPEALMMNIQGTGLPGGPGGAY